jgi:cytochrome P450
MMDEATTAGHGKVKADDEEMIKNLAGIVYMAGADTTVSAVISFFLAMVVHPEVQKKGQAEIDRVIGHDRLPEMTDKDDLPYVNAIIQECYRWLPVLPMGTCACFFFGVLPLIVCTGVPHAVARDDEYNGYLIPKGAIVMGAAWSILHNAEDYPEPETFNPERFLLTNADGSLSMNPAVKDPQTACFGFGRRICPGRHVAHASLFATVTTVLATLDVMRAKGADGAEIMPEIEQSSGLLSHPKPFDYALRPRSEKAKALLAASLEH